MRTFGRIFVAGIFLLVLACGTAPNGQTGTAPTTAPEPSAAITDVAAVATIEAEEPVAQATQVVVETAAAPSAPSGTVKSESAVRVRAQPNTEADNIVGKADPDEAVTLTGRLEDSSWYAVQTTDGVQGWIRADLLTVDSAIAGALPVAAAEPVVEAPVEPVAALSPDVQAYMTAAQEPVSTYVRS